MVWSPSSSNNMNKLHHWDHFQSDERMKDTHPQLKFTGQDILSCVFVLLLMDGWIAVGIAEGLLIRFQKKSPPLFD